ncbi:hypothetical protein [Nonomuraea africana]|uniref:Uncharacterized protein n=1 Tax=Nonomuraea africana TaxID=46171 RepID=A0ABR9KDJ5_9ACTN|nr:hypothetical protein [Nonomuraea africana]MBE1560103.1 hypothetical protein [Nonomuraea africana]
MLRRHRSALPALLVTGLYGAALTVAVVVALISGSLGPLWWLTLFATVTEGVAATGQNLLLLVLAGLSWAWGIWQILRGPLAGPPPQQDRNTLRLRVALYVATATTWLLHVTASSMWADATVIDSAAMWVVVLLFMRVLGRDRQYTRGAGVLGYGGFTVIGVLDLVGWPVPDGAELICGLAGLAWTALVLRAQGYDDRWGTATVAYGIAALVAPIFLVLAALPFPDEGSAVEALGVVSSVLIMIWLARSAHDLAAPRHQPAAQTTLEA